MDQGISGSITATYAVAAPSHLYLKEKEKKSLTESACILHGGLRLRQPSQVFCRAFSWYAVASPLPFSSLF